jgi:hypothetical protein
MSVKKALYTIAVPSTDFNVEAYFDGKGASPAIRFGYKRDGLQHQEAITFSRVLAVRTRAERSCKAWHIEGAYDTLVEIEDSPWVKEVVADISEQWRDKWEAHHFMIYLDSAGCFEVIAESWTAI